MGKLRVGVVGFLHEAMMRSPLRTDEDACRVFRGEELRGVDNWPAVPGAIARLEREPDIAVVPLLFARCLSGGSIARGFYERIKAESLAMLRDALPLDGLVVANHGAMEVDGLGLHGDTDYVLAIRALVGPDLPIAIPFDMHGQATPELLAATTVFSILRTAPHRDIRETGARAADQLVAVLRGRLAPCHAMVHVPILIPGEKAMTAFPPARTLFGRLADFDAVPGVVEANIFIGFGWNDESWIGMRAMVTANGDPALARRCAEELAEAIWAERRAFVLAMENHAVDDGLRIAAASTQAPTYVTDSGDNVSAGAAGDLTLVLQRILALDVFEDVVVAGILAPHTVRDCIAAGAGAAVAIELGREHISAGIGQTRQVTGIVEACGADVRLAEATDGATPKLFPGAWARVRIGPAIVTFHAVRIYVSTPAHFRALGIDPVAHKVYVVKFGYLLPMLEDIAARNLLLRSEGSAAMEFADLPWHRVARPAFPLDPDMQWSVGSSLTLCPAPQGARIAA